MSGNYLFTEEEQNKISFIKLISQLFLQYKELHTISISLYTCSLIEKGKVMKTEPKLKLATTFKYDTFYCFWFNGGAQPYEDEEQLKEKLWQCSVSTLLNNNSPINFYLKADNKKITYNDFESDILNKCELEEKRIDSIFAENKKISFCRDSVKEDIDLFLGSELVGKQNAYSNASSLAKELSKKDGKRYYIKI